MSAKLSVIAIAVSSALLLSACGGGGGGGTTAAPSSVITGTAAAGAPIIGKVTVKDSLGAQKTVDIEADGTYRVDVADMTGPFLFRAAGTVGGRDVVYVSAATSADVGNTINITPFTDLIVANIAGMAAEQYFTNNNPSATTLTASELSTATTTLTTRLKPVLEAMGVAASIDLLRTTFKADRSGLDAVMDVVKVTVDPTTAQATIKNLITAQEIKDDLQQKTDADALPAPTTDQEAALKTAVTDLGQIDAAFKLINSYIATEVPSGARLESLRALFDPEFLDFGQTLDQLMSSEGLLNANNVGMTLSNPVIVKRSADGSIMWVRYQFKNDTYGENGSEVMAFRKDANGKWRALGNRQLGDTSIQAVNARHLSGGQYTYQRVMEFWVDERTDNRVQYVNITGPGLPGNWTLGDRTVQGIVLKRSTNAGLAPFVTLNKAGNVQGGSWIYLCGDAQWLGANDICVDGSQLGVDNEYAVTYYDINGNELNDPLGRNFKITVPRAPRSNADAEANASQWFATFTEFAPATFSQITKGSAITYSWTLPGNTLYFPQDIGFSANNVSFSQNVKPTATVGVVGTWDSDVSPTASVGAVFMGAIALYLRSMSDPPVDKETPLRKNIKTISPQEKQTQNEIKVNDRVVIGEVTEEQRQRPETIKAPNRPSPIWEKELQKTLVSMGGETIENVSIKKVASVIWMKNYGGVNAESVIITLRNKEGAESTFRALVDSASGRILETWDRTIFEPVGHRGHHEHTIIDYKPLIQD